jgi:hypothetical protein
MKKGLEGLRPPAGGSGGKPGFPNPLAEVLCSREAPCAGRTTPDATGPGARAGRPRHGSAGTVPALSRTLPHWERAPGYRRERNGRGLPEAAKWKITRSESPLKARRELYPPGCIALWQAVCGFTEPHAYVRAYRAPGASPQWREAGRGAERGARWSPQPSMRLRRTPNGVKKVLPGRAQPFQILAPGGGMGKPGLPIPLAEGLCSRKKRQAAPRTWVLLLLGYSPLNPGSMPENTRKALARCPMRGIDGALHALL